MTRADVLLAMQGDQQAFGRLVAATCPAVSAIALAITRDRETAHDAAQDSYLAAWQAIGRLRSPDSFLPWLRQIARSIARSTVRARARRSRREVSEPLFESAVMQIAAPGARPDDFLVLRQEGAALAAALEALPDETRECVVLYYTEDHSAEQVASLLGISAAAVRKRLERARHTLREDVARRLAEEGRRIRLSTMTTVMAALGAAPRDSSAIGIAMATTIGPVPLAAGVGAALGMTATVARIRAIGKAVDAAAARRFIVVAVAATVALGGLLPLWRPRLLWLWFAIYQALIACAVLYWLPRHGVPIERRDLGKWFLRALAGTIAVSWAVLNM